MFVKVYRFMAWYRFVETMECEDVISLSIFLIFSTPTFYVLCILCKPIQPSGSKYNLQENS